MFEEHFLTIGIDEEIKVQFTDGVTVVFTPETTKKVSLNMAQVAYMSTSKGGDDNE